MSLMADKTRLLFDHVAHHKQGVLFVAQVYP